MKVAVCVKQIPDRASPYELDPSTHNLVRPNEQVLDDTDRYGVEVGLQIAGDTEGTVTLVSMGPSGNLNGIRQALAMGADGAILVDDEALKGSDSLTTARILAAAIAPESFDIVIAGTESTDGYSGHSTATRRTSRRAGADLCQKDRCGRFDSSYQPADRHGLRYGRSPYSGCGFGDGWSCRASLSDLQRHHGCQEEAGRHQDRRRPGRRNPGRSANRDGGPGSITVRWPGRNR